MIRNELLSSLAAIVGEDHVILDQDKRELASADIFTWPGAVVAEVVVRPGSVDELSRVSALLADNQMAMVPRGAGLSYTAGVVPHDPAVVIDVLRMDQILVHTDDLYAVVGAGASWEKLAQVLKPHGLRAAQISPISGSHSTVGGTASQNIPGGVDNVIGLTVVLADGTVVRTGSSARERGSGFLRYAGPDLTGLFLGDCGAFGIKAEIVVRLMPEREVAFASFSFERAEDMLGALITLRQRDLITRAFSMDQLKGESAAKVDAGEALAVVGAVVKQAGSMAQAFKDLSQLAMGRKALKDVAKGGWSLHLTVEAANQSIAEAQMELARAVCRDTGKEIDNVIPKTMRSKPYSVRGFIGPEGERWVPVHCILPLSRAQDCMKAMQAKLELEREALEAVSANFSWIISSIGAYIMIEPMFYWKDRLDPIHMQYLSDRNKKRFGGGVVNQDARVLIARLRNELRDIMDNHDAAHGQLGRFYPYLPLLDAGSQNLVARIKSALDPDGRSNPGVLGL